MAYLEQFHHKISGPESAPRLVFLHGLMGYWANWRGIMSSFENDFRVLAYDQRGHGRSFKPATGYAPENYADDLLTILDELGWPEISLVGHSMGGRAGVSFASRFPQRIKKLVVEDIGPEPEGDDIRYFENLFARVPTPFRDKKVAKELLYNSFDPALGAYLYSNIDETEPGVFDWRFSKNAIFESVTIGHSKARWDEWTSLKAQTLLVRGALSRALSRSVFEKTLKLNSNIQGVEIEGSGHWVHSEKPKEFVAAMKEFFSK